MAGQFKTKRRKGENYRLILPGVLIALALVLMLISGGFLAIEQQETTQPQLQQQPESTTSSVPQQSTPPTTPPVTKVSTATIGSTGDLLLHNKVIRSGYDQATGTYNYDDIFTYFCGAVYDDNVIGKIKMSVDSVNIIYEMLAVKWIEQDEQLSAKDIQQIVYHYSRELEHSDLNLEMMEG